MQADYVVTSQDGFSPFVAAAGDALAPRRRGEVVTSVRSELGEVAGSGRYVTGHRAGTIADGVHASTGRKARTPSLGELGANGAIVSRGLRRRQGPRRSASTLRRSSADGERARARRQGHLRAAALLPAPRRGHDPAGDLRLALRAAAQPVHVHQRRRASPTRRRRPLEQAVADFPDAKVQTRERVDRRRRTRTSTSS